MLLAIDIGNTNVVIGCLDEEHNTNQLFRMVSDLEKTVDEYAASIKSVLDFNEVDCSKFEGAIICSVVPPLTELFRVAVRKITGLNALIVGTGVKTGLNIMIENPASLGGDLVATAVAAMSDYKVPVIIFDLGTATTITAVDKNGNYIGGAFYPGVSLSMNALSSGTSLLQKVPIEPPKKVINTMTIESMQSGAVFGTASMMDGMIERFEEEIGEKCSYVATGGLAGKIVPYCKHEIVCDDNLLLRGLGIIYKKNKRK